MTTHSERLVTVASLDGYLLHGAQFTPADGGRGSLPIVWIHGFTGYFYEDHAVAIGRRLAERGHVFVTGNNRGHDLGASLEPTRGGDPLRGGAYWEKLEDAPNDVAAWIGFAVDLGFPQVALVGHSLGAMKSVTYMGTRGDDRVAALVSASGPVHVMRRWADDPARIALAEDLVAGGHGRELLPPEPDRPMLISAEAYLSRARSRVDVFGSPAADSPVSRVIVPLLVILGSEEPHIGQQADLERVKQHAVVSPRVDTFFVPGADHCYVNREAVVADLLADWLESLA